eukprot:365990-Chlamydomonas_euryale.AAC.4
MESRALFSDFFRSPSKLAYALGMHCTLTSRGRARGTTRVRRRPTERGGQTSDPDSARHRRLAPNRPKTSGPA